MIDYFQAVLTTSLLPMHGNCYNSCLNKNVEYLGIYIGEVILKKNSAQQCETSRDSLAKGLYTR